MVTYCFIASSSTDLLCNKFLLQQSSLIQHEQLRRKHMVVALTLAEGFFCSENRVLH